MHIEYSNLVVRIVVLPQALFRVQMRKDLKERPPLSLAYFLGALPMGTLSRDYGISLTDIRYIAHRLEMKKHSSIPFLLSTCNVSTGHPGDESNEAPGDVVQCGSAHSSSSFHQAFHNHKSILDNKKIETGE